MLKNPLNIARFNHQATKFMNDQQLHNALTKATKNIIDLLKKNGYKEIDENYDDGECRIVYEHPNNSKVTVELMFQEY